MLDDKYFSHIVSHLTTQLLSFKTVMVFGLAGGPVGLESRIL